MARWMDGWRQELSTDTNFIGFRSNDLQFNTDPRNIAAENKTISTTATERSNWMLLYLVESSLRIDYNS